MNWFISPEEPVICSCYWTIELLEVCFLKADVNITEMQSNYYQNTLYPLQDKVFRLLACLPVDFYITGGTALSRAYLNHRYSDDLDFFLNGSDSFKIQAETVVKNLPRLGLRFEILLTDEGFLRLVVYDNSISLKLDFVNDVPFRSGVPVSTKIYHLTDTPENILSNKISALSRLAVKDLVDIVFICGIFSFKWTEVISEAFQKDMWVNPVQVAKILDDFPIVKLNEINWINEPPSHQWFKSQLEIIIRDVLQGNQNSIYKPGQSEK